LTQADQVVYHDGNPIWESKEETHMQNEMTDNIIELITEASQKLLLLENMVAQLKATLRDLNEIATT